MWKYTEINYINKLTGYSVKMKTAETFWLGNA